MAISTGDVSRLALRIAPNGDAIAGYEDWTEQTLSRVVVRRYYEALGEWTAPDALDDHLAFGPRGNVVAAWVNWNLVEDEVRVARQTCP
jgi:hypothetical protein